MLVPILLFILGLILVIKGGDWFVDGSVELAHRLHVPELIIGATVVSIGTTLPEVLVSATGALGGHGGIAYGNAIGSVICNTALISALTFAIRPCKVDAVTYKVPVIFFFAAAALYAGTAYATGVFSRWIGVILLVIFAIYIFYTIRNGKKNGLIGGETGETAENEKEMPLWQTILKLAGGAVCIARYPDCRKPGCAGIRDRTDLCSPGHKPAGTGDRDYGPGQGAQRSEPGKHRRREPVQSCAGERAGHGHPALLHL